MRSPIKSDRSVVDQIDRSINRIDLIESDPSNHLSDRIKSLTDSQQRVWRGGREGQYHFRELLVRLSHHVERHRRLGESMQITGY